MGAVRYYGAFFLPPKENQTLVPQQLRKQKPIKKARRSTPRPITEMPTGTIEDIIEPYLIQCGFLQRTPRGRLVTGHGFRHLGLPEPVRDPAQFGYFCQWR